MYYFIFILLSLSFWLSGCQEKVTGCMHPRAINFDPEADESGACNFYELVLEMQHFTSATTNDTLLLGDTLYDALDTAFILNSFAILCSETSLIQTAQATRMRGAEQLSMSRVDGSEIQVEDNFFIISPEIYSYNISEWKELGSFDSVQFFVGTNSILEAADPSSVSEQNHPLSNSSIPYLFDEDSSAYLALDIQLSLVHGALQKELKLVNYLKLALPFNGTVVDGSNTILPLRLNYDVLFNNVSVFNDTEAEIQSKLLQNIANAISTF